MINIKKIFSSLALAAALIAPPLAHAQSSDAIALTITPPFFEINVNPGDTWASSIRVVNTNASDLTVHASLAGFAPSDSQGHGTFINASSLANDQDALANWIILGTQSVTVPRGQASEVPFTIVVPKNAAPGGHYAAILVGTAPGGAGNPGSHVGVSTFISALIFVRVSGNIKEEGNIQEFSTDHSNYATPDVNFTVKFANTGNVHVRPAGEIDIYNVFGKKQATVPINDGGNLGYVLPSSTREFDLAWHGTPSILGIGPYTAVLTLGYGENGNKSVSRTIGFWILPVWSLLEILLDCLVAGAIVFYLLRKFIRRMLAREMMRYGVSPDASRHKVTTPAPPPRPQAQKDKGDVIDLRKP